MYLDIISKIRGRIRGLNKSCVFYEYLDSERDDKREDNSDSHKEGEDVENN